MVSPYASSDRAVQAPSGADGGGILSRAPNVLKASGGVGVLVEPRAAFRPTAPHPLPEGSSMETKTSQLREGIARDAGATAIPRGEEERGREQRAKWEESRCFRGRGGRPSLPAAPPRDCALHNRGRARHKWRTPVQIESDSSEAPCSAPLCLMDVRMNQ